MNRFLIILAALSFFLVLIVGINQSFASEVCILETKQITSENLDLE